MAVTGGAQRSASGACDRACLEGFVDRYLDAMLAHDPKLVPLMNKVKFTENGQRLQIPDALWNSIAAKGTYRLFVSDPEAREVAFHRHYPGGGAYAQRRTGGFGTAAEDR